MKKIFHDFGGDHVHSIHLSDCIIYNSRLVKEDEETGEESSSAIEEGLSDDTDRQVPDVRPQVGNL